MSQIETTGTFRGTIVDCGLATSTNGYPQLVLALKGTEYWDEDEEVWVDWSQEEANSITAYLILFGGEERVTLNYRQCMAAFNWDGIGFQKLLDLIEPGVTQIQFRVEQHIYEGNVSLRVNWIDNVDAVPGRTIQKLNPEEVAALDQKYASAFKKAAGPQTVKPVGKPEIPKKVEAPEPQEVPEDQAPPSPPKSESQLKSKQKPESESKPAQNKCSQLEAWTACKKAKDPSVSENQLADIWLEAVETIAPDGDESKMTDELWAQVRDVVVERVKSDIPF